MYKNSKLTGGSIYAITFHKPITIGLKPDVVLRVIKRWKDVASTLGIDENIGENFSSEGGFELPITAIWLNKLRDNSIFVNYHNARQLRFVQNNNNLVGLRFKDNIVSWSTEEINLITDILHGVCEDLGNNATNLSSISPVLSNINLGNATTFYFNNALPIQLKLDFMIKVINKARNNNILRLLDQNFSSDGGFQLPITHEWKIVLYNYSNSRYHNFRELHFISTDEYVIGVRTKDAIPYWTIDEINNLLSICNDVIASYKLPLISINTLAFATSINNLSGLNTPLNLSNIIDPNTNQPYIQNTLTFDIDSDVSVIDKYKHSKIKFNKPIELKFKEKILINAIKKAKKNKYLKNIQLGDSDEGGFVLPMTKMWKKYADSSVTEREVEFIINEDNDTIVGLEFVEGYSLWTNDEVDEILAIINKIYKSLIKK
jgi:hypothetical protein